MKNILDFIESCTDCWHTAKEVENTLVENGFEYLDEGDKWDLKGGGKYYTMRNMSSIIAFKIPDKNFKSYMITAAHGESPAFKIKAKAELDDGKYIRLNTEAYGSMQLSTWLDRPLSVSGRVVVEDGNFLKAKLINIDRDALIIPSLAPHLDRAKGEKEINIQRDMPPLYAMHEEEGSFLKEIANALKVSTEQIKGCDLMLYNRERGRIWGKNNEFISAPRLDDLQCVYALQSGFIDGENKKTAQVFCVFDNEEVGSGTKQGAKSDFLSSTLFRISEAFQKDYSEHMQMRNSSFLVSADNAHAIHPNRKEVSDCTNFPIIDGGVVIKYNASQKYTTDAVSEAIFKKICESAGVPTQTYANRSDIAGGSTLGNLATEKTCINTVDVGLPQLSMHSACETAGTKDTEYMIAAIKEFYNSSIECKNNEFKILK